MAQPPLCHRSLNSIDQGADGDDGPGNETDEKDDEVVEEGLMVLEAVGGEALEIVFEEEEAVERGVALLNGDVPGQHHE